MQAKAAFGHLASSYAENMTGPVRLPRATAIFAAVVILVWFVSGWCCIRFGDGVNYQFQFRNGGFIYEWGPYNIRDIHIGHCNYVHYARHLQVDWASDWDDFGWGLWWAYRNKVYSAGDAIRFVVVPLWPVPAAAIAGWFVPWLRRKRCLNGVFCCKQCEYNLNGNTSGICPECGGAIAPQKDDAPKDAR